MAYHARAELIQAVDPVEIMQDLRRDGLTKPNDSDVSVF